MMKKSIADYLTTPDVSVKEAMRQMNRVGEKILFVVDGERILLGALTDGDIRRWILKDGSLQTSIEQIFNRKPISHKLHYDPKEVSKIMLDNKLTGIPLIDDKNQVEKILLWEDVFRDGEKVERAKLDIPVVIMAGGRGSRLEPFTRVLPKPLIPIGGKVIIEIILDQFEPYGVNEFFVSVNHKSKMIKSYFEEMNSDRTISYIEEEEPLGTAGGLKFLKDKVKDIFLVSNCDIIIDCDYNEVVEFHRKHEYDMTIVGSFRHFVIPYGICEIGNGGLLTGMTEKPEYDFLVNTGMYILDKKTLDVIPPNQKYHVTDLINDLKKKNGRIGVFPINEKAWVDIGQWEEYRKAVAQFEEHL